MHFSTLLSGLVFAQTALAAAFNHKSMNRTCSEPSLKTWWHNTGEINTETPVRPGNVRQSHRYLVQVAVAGSGKFYDSFVYESIPRNGNGKIFSPWDPANSQTFDTYDVSDNKGYDGISVESQVGVNMAWTQFEYTEDVDVKILRRDGVSLGATSNVITRPQMQKYRIKTTSDGGIVIRIPKDVNGRKFSVEFQDDLYTYRSDGQKYVLSGGEAVAVEPTNALVIFASAPIPKRFIPSLGQATVMKPGPINNGDWGTKPVLYFPPGVYWMNQNVSGQSPAYGQNHMILSPNTNWVYLAPGAYVKGAIEFATTTGPFYSTGHGVLSGEHYVYQANVNESYQAIKSDQTSLRLWWHNNIQTGQQWYCQGPTIANPPFNTMDFNGKNNETTSRISDYKQVGAFFVQTDGPQNYPNSLVEHVFYHANDDGFKLYYSNVTITNATIWKVHNDPIIQMGWTTRNVSGVVIDGLNIIHTRHWQANMVVPSAIIGASPFYSSGQVIDPSSSISDMLISNVVCEGSQCPSLVRINPLQNYKNFNIKNVAYPDGLSQTYEIGQSEVPYVSNVTVNLKIENWTVKGQKVTRANYGVGQLGQFNISSGYDGQWTIS